MTATFAGLDILSGILELPRVGAWVADLELDAEAVPPAWIGKLTLNLDDALVLRGTVHTSRAFVGRVRVRVVGGAGGLSAPAVARDFANTPARIPLEDALMEGGESLSPTSDADVVGTYLQSWTRATSTVGESLEMLTGYLGAAWRVLPDGTVWVGTETWPASEAQNVQVLEDDGKEGRLVLHADTPLFLPGTVVDGRRLSRVTVRISPTGYAVTALTEREGEATLGDRLFDFVARLVRRAMSRVDYYALYYARVVVQHADGTVDLEPEDPRMPPKSRVTLRSGLPGVKVKVAPGARVHLGFSNGDPRKPIATAWGYDGMTELSFGGGAAPMMRQGDMVSTSIPPGFQITAACVGLVAPPGGGPVTGVAQLTVIQAPVPLAGIGITGAGSVKA